MGNEDVRNEEMHMCSTSGPGLCISLLSNPPNMAGWQEVTCIVIVYQTRSSLTLPMRACVQGYPNN